MRLVFDVGATRTRMAEVLPNGSLGKIERFTTDASVEGAATLRRQLRELAGTQPVEAIAGDIAGAIDGEGVVVTARNLPLWQGQAVGAMLGREFSCPVQILNDVVLCGLGEAHNGAGITTGEMAYLTVSTGVNAVRLRDGAVDTTIGKYHVGRQIIAGGPAHAASLEDLVGGAATEQRTGKHPADIHEPAFWQQTAQYVARGIFNLRIFWDPAVVVLGGSMMRDVPLEAVELALNTLSGTFDHPVELRRASLDDTAGLLGAVVYLEK